MGIQITNKEKLFNIGTYLKVSGEPNLYGEILGVFNSPLGVVYDVYFWNNDLNFHYRTDVFHETILENLECGYYSICYKNENF